MHRALTQLAEGIQIIMGFTCGFTLSHVTLCVTDIHPRTHATLLPVKATTLHEHELEFAALLLLTNSSYKPKKNTATLLCVAPPMKEYQQLEHCVRSLPTLTPPRILPSGCPLFRFHSRLSSGCHFLPGVLDTYSLGSPLPPTAPTRGRGTMVALGSSVFFATWTPVARAMARQAALRE